MKCELPRPFELKGLDEDGRFAGYASVFGVRDDYADVVAEGAFARSLATARANGQMPAMLWQHDARCPIGVWTEIAEDSAGLKVSGKLAVGTQAGREAYELLRLGAINGLSIGYVTVSSEFAPQQRQRVLTEIDLWEVSLVTFPANPQARVTRVKEGLRGGRRQLPARAEGEVYSKDVRASLTELALGLRRNTNQIQNILKGV